MLDLLDPWKRAYRQRLRRGLDVTAPIKCLLATRRCGPEEFKARLRAEAMGMFYSYWRSNGPWRSEPSVRTQYLVSPGINVAAFVGSLFRYELVSGDDAHGCLDVLLSTGSSFLKLQAAHAAIVHCGELIYAGKTGCSCVQPPQRTQA
ncbi:hypothetical protein B0H17DRAFT_1217096 [Mycena rosella]|uniref:Uncharacterized protein n=1 Tax=Mycena rosella TaxID=1033263 RepID=A0AAD7C2S7_MYCRO|nr:hypothetical protein B0H17DRAFT_1217096 [Mycena rosella]